MKMPSLEQHSYMQFNNNYTTVKQNLSYKDHGIIIIVNMQS